MKKLLIFLLLIVGLNLQKAHSQISGYTLWFKDTNNVNGLGGYYITVPANTAASLLTGLTPGQVGLGNVTNESKASMFSNPTFTGVITLPNGSISNAFLANAAVANLSGTNSGDNAANTTYANDFRAANFIAGTNYLAPSGNGSALTGLTAAQVGLGNVNNTSDASKPISTATQSAINAKQDALVSGTTIKTINGASILGNGDLVVSGSGVSRIFLPNDVTNNNASANTLQDVTGLGFQVVANTTYKFRFVIIYNSAATTTGSRWTINGPAATFINYVSQYPTSATAFTMNNSSGYNLPSSSNSASLTSSNICVIEGEIRPSSDGTVIARFASEVSSSAVTAVASGRSYVEYQVIAN